MNFSKSISQSDYIGSIASGLCIVHCAATPFLFIAQSCASSCCDTGPTWWSALDYLFIIITFFAVYFSAKNSSKKIIKYALYINWVVLSLLMVNAHASFFPIPDIWKYGAALSLICLHFYNLKYCRCADDGCCVAA